MKKEEAEAIYNNAKNNSIGKEKKIIRSKI